MANRLTYTDKNNYSPVGSQQRTWFATDAMMIKSVVNSHADDIEALETSKADLIGGKLDPNQLPELSLFDVIVPSQTNLTDFCNNYFSYIFQRGDMIVIEDSANGVTYVYMFMGGDKSLESNYQLVSQILEEGSGSVALETGGIKTIKDNPSYFGTVGVSSIDYSFADSGTNDKGATGDYAVALGMNTISSGDYSFSTTGNNVASGINSIAMGDNTLSSSTGGISIGKQLVNDSFSATMLGSYNTLGTYNDISWLDTDPILVVGNGQDEMSRSNALELLKSGKLILPTYGTQTHSGVVEYILGVTSDGEIIEVSTNTNSVNWGNISGNILDQDDLVAELDTKVESSEVTDLIQDQGTFTASFVGNTSGSFTLPNQNYIKIGNQVTLFISTTDSDFTSLVGQITMQNLPFNASISAVGSPVFHSNTINYPTNSKNLITYAQSNLVAFHFVGDLPTEELEGSHFSSINTLFRFSITYITN